MKIKKIRKNAACDYTVFIEGVTLRLTRDGGLNYQGYTKKEVIRDLRRHGYTVPRSAM